MQIAERIIMPDSDPQSRGAIRRVSLSTVAVQL